MSTMDNSRNGKPRIVIIGAGIAGLSAADHLVRNGLKNVTLLEATDRIGGRMYTKEFGGDGRIVELGANWIHGAAMNNSIFRLASQHRLLDPYILLKRVQGHVYTSTGQAIDPGLTDNIFKLFLQWEDEEGSDKSGLPFNSQVYFTQKLKEILEKSDIKDHLHIECVVNALINYEQFHRGDHLSLSPSIDTGYEEIPGGNVKVPKGMISILHSLYDNLPADAVRLGQEACQVLRRDQDVEIMCKFGESYIADHVIVTCSLGVLKACHMKMFQPTLPESKQQAIKDIGFGRVNKIFLKYKVPFWVEGNGGVYLGWKNAELSDKDSKWYKHIFGFDEVMNNPNVLVAWISGAGAEELEKLEDQEVKETCTQLLRQFLNDPSVPYPQEVLRSQWVSNPHTLGSYSYWNHDTKSNSYHNLLSPVLNSANEPQLCFAGEATNPTYYSTMHAARSSGLREAERLLQFYRLMPKNQLGEIDSKL